MIMGHDYDTPFGKILSKSNMKVVGFGPEKDLSYVKGDLDLWDMTLN